MKLEDKSLCVKRASNGFVVSFNTGSMTKVEHPLLSSLGLPSPETQEMQIAVFATIQELNEFIASYFDNGTAKLLDASHTPPR